MPEANVAADPVVPVVQAWLRSKRSTLFGRGFDLSQNPDAAARWFTEQMDDFMRYADAYQRRA